MTLKTSFASVLRALRSKRNISQRDFADTTSRTYLSKLELGKSSITLDKLSQRLQLSPLTLLTLNLSEDTGRPVSELVSGLQAELADLHRGEGLPGLGTMLSGNAHAAATIGRRIRTAKYQSSLDSRQAELVLTD